MRSVAVALVLLLVVAASTYAQGKTRVPASMLGVFAGGSIPVGDFENFARTGFGVGGKYQKRIGPTIVLTGSAAYMTWSEREFLPGVFSSIRAFEILVGGKYFFSKGFFGLLEGGLNFFEKEASGSGSGSGSETSFMMPFGLGYQFEGVEFAAKYYIFHFDYQHISFTLGYGFEL